MSMRADPATANFGCGFSRSLKRARKTIAIFAAATLGILIVNVPAMAHKVNVFAYVEGDKVVVEGYFGGKVKAQNCAVEVFDESGKKIREGRTDEKGLYTFKLADLPAFSGSLKIVLEASMGHKAQYTLSAADIPGSGKKNAPLTAQSRETKPEQTLPRPPAPASTQVVDQAALTAALESVMDKKLAPITRMLGKQEKLLLEEKFGGPKLTDIIGGIGWIVGLVGLAAFFWGRNRSEKK